MSNPALPSEIWSIAYVSRATIRFDDEQLERLLVDARAFNKQHAVTGVLLCSTGIFMQYFEGPLASVEAAYERIRASTRHTDITELTHAYAGQRVFGDWQMGLLQPSRSQILRLSTANWKARLRAAGMRAAVPAGLELLRGFWYDEQRATTGQVLGPRTPRTRLPDRNRADFRPRPPAAASPVDVP